jgi:hypothetical protein
MSVVAMKYRDEAVYFVVPYQSTETTPELA